VATYSYDADGRRIRKVVTGSGDLNGTTDFYLDGWQEIEEHDGANAVTQQYVYGSYIDEPLVVDTNLTGTPKRYFYHQNTLYSVYALTDTGGNIAEGYLYDAYGRQTVYDPGASGVVTFGAGDVVTPGGHSLVGNPYLFTGRRLDPETGLYYYRARYRDATEGRFIERDQVGYTAREMNLYAYAGDGPTNDTDPSGHGPGEMARYNRMDREDREKKELREKFMKWYDDNQDTSWVKVLPPCPCCIMGRVWARKGSRDMTRFEIVPGIVNPDTNVWDDPKSWQLTFFRIFVVDFHPGATYDMRTTDKPEYNGAGQQCTYDDKGNLITHGPGAGTADKGSASNRGAHMREDVDPFKWALELDGGKPGRYVDMYISRRPPDEKNKCHKNPP
jgi:RHS repeat-associated protein